MVVSTAASSSQQPLLHLHRHRRRRAHRRDAAAAQTEEILNHCMNLNLMSPIAYLKSDTISFHSLLTMYLAEACLGMYQRNGFNQREQLSNCGTHTHSANEKQWAHVRFPTVYQLLLAAAPTTGQI